MPILVCHTHFETLVKKTNEYVQSLPVGLGKNWQELW